LTVEPHLLCVIIVSTKKFSKIVLFVHNFAGISPCLFSLQYMYKLFWGPRRLVSVARPQICFPHASCEHCSSNIHSLWRHISNLINNFNIFSLFHFEIVVVVVVVVFNCFCAHWYLRTTRQPRDGVQPYNHDETESFKLRHAYNISSDGLGVTPNVSILVYVPHCRSIDLDVMRDTIKASNNCTILYDYPF